jgi:uncharacterized protein YndB with AHSA1/START domain
VSLLDYHFIDAWTVDAPPDVVWDVVSDPRTYPRWWPEFIDVRRLNEIDGVGARAAAHVKASLPYHLHFELEAARYDRPHVSEARATGDLVGVMRWVCAPYNGGTYVVFEERVRTGKRVLNLLAPVGKPFFAWAHGRMMEHGAAGLRAELRSHKPV